MSQVRNADQSDFQEQKIFWIISWSIINVSITNITGEINYIQVKKGLRDVFHYPALIFYVCKCLPASVS
jgi:hypothetical protein